MSVTDSKAIVWIELWTNEPDVLKKLETLGLELPSKDNGKTVTGRIAIEKLAALAEI